MFEQAVHEFGARVFLLVGGRGRIGRKEHARLDVDQRCRHEDEFAGDVDVHLLEQVEIVEVLLGDLGNGNVVDIDLLLADEVEQQVERSLVDRDFHRRRWSCHVGGALGHRTPHCFASAFDLGWYAGDRRVHRSDGRLYG